MSRGHRIAPSLFENYFFLVLKSLISIYQMGLTRTVKFKFDLKCEKIIIMAKNKKMGKHQYEKQY